MSRRGAWIVGGGTLIGLGVGLILLQTSVLWFVASILIGIGLGLAISAFLEKSDA